MLNFGMVFPGQGSQFLGMLSNLSKNFPIVRKTFSESSDILGYDLWKLIQYGTAYELNKTWIAQPALLSASFCIFQIWKEKIGIFPKIIAGHSLGEYSALVCANVLDFKSAIKIVELRGKLMQKSISKGVGALYAIIGLRKELIFKACKYAAKNQVVSILSFNSPKQIVIGGIKSAVKRAVLLCKKFGAKHVIRLTVTVPSHCILMNPMLKKFKKILKMFTFKSPNISVINNVDVKIETKADLIRDALIRQLCNPVRWVEIIKFMEKKRIKVLLEIGPKNVLTGLNKCISNAITSVSINHVKDINYYFQKMIKQK